MVWYKGNPFMVFVFTQINSFVIIVVVLNGQEKKLLSALVVGTFPFFFPCSLFIHALFNIFVLREEFLDHDYFWKWQLISVLCAPLWIPCSLCWSLVCLCSCVFQQWLCKLGAKYPERSGGDNCRYEMKPLPTSPFEFDCFCSFEWLTSSLIPNVPFFLVLLNIFAHNKSRTACIMDCLMWVICCVFWGCGPWHDIDEPPRDVEEILDIIGP
jgi:hypothetical protein